MNGWSQRAPALHGLLFVGSRPLYLAASLFLWLVFGGYGVTRVFAAMLG
ncbi:MAG: hypothetical protein PHW05_10015 [Tepidiphilus sp.]|jgi:hypothetical protein|nr:hypothetical protein [Tepidiphilus sp.]